MNDLPYILERGNKKHHCPSCEKKRFVRYVTVETGEYLPDVFGRCDREVKCGYHLSPYKEGYKPDQTSNPDVTAGKPKVKRQPQPILLFPDSKLQQTLKGYDDNVFLQNLHRGIPHPIRWDRLQSVIDLYKLGTITDGYRKGAITIPFIDVNNGVRAIQVKTFDETNHTTSTGWIHTLLQRHYQQTKQPEPKWLTQYVNNDSFVSCLFGEHLLKLYPNNPIALVEAPKTAIYGTLYFGLPDAPDKFIWLAVYNLSSLNLKKCKVLNNRPAGVFLFPDLSDNGRAFQLWSEKVDSFKKDIPNTKFHVSDFLEKNASIKDREKGADLADFLIQHDYRVFDPPKKRRKTPGYREIDLMVSNRTAGQFNHGHAWDQQIQDLEAFFEGIEIPNSPVKLDVCTTVSNPSKMIENHLETVKRNNSNRHFLPYLTRLQTLKSVLTTQPADNV